MVVLFMHDSGSGHPSFKEEGGEIFLLIFKFEIQILAGARSKSTTV